MHVLSFTTLFPNYNQFNHGIFVKNRLQHLIQDFPDVTLRVIAPVPYYPAIGFFYKRYRNYIGIEKQEQHGNLKVFHPRYLAIPKIGVLLNPFSLYYAGLKAVKQYIRIYGKPHLIDAHYIYPDGVVACWIGEKLNIPVVMTARGTDINLLPEYNIPGKLIKNALVQTTALISVCSALKERLVELEANERKIYVMRNGVDLNSFTSLPQIQARRHLNLPEHSKIILSVGHLIERKGHHLIIQALKKLPHCHLVIVGDGEMKKDLYNLMQEHNLSAQITFLGVLPHNFLKHVYSAADILVLASSREGWPNVLLEAMACGTPVIATPVWGSPEIIQSPQAGILTKTRSVEALTEAIKYLLSNLPDRKETRLYAEKFSWYQTSQDQYNLFKAIMLGTYDCNQTIK